MTLRIALFQPDIPQNTGTILRFGACMGFAVDIIEPAGFAMTEKGLRRAGMDYLAIANMKRHADWDLFLQSIGEEKRRLILLTTKSDQSTYDFKFRETDTLLFGRESAGVPDKVQQIADHCITLPMQGEARSLNIAMSVAMAASEAKRQLALF